MATTWGRLKHTHPKSIFIGQSAWARNPKREAQAGFDFNFYVQKPLGLIEIAIILANALD